MSANRVYGRLTVSSRAIGRAPIPREHGAWVILYAPLALAFVAARPSSTLPAILITTAVTGAFLARNALGPIMRRRNPPGAGFWLGLFSLIFLSGAVPLILAYKRIDLIPVGLIVCGAFGVHALLAALPSRTRLDRSQAGELLAVAALAMTGPAGYVAASGRLDSTAWWIWLACTLFFGSAVLRVKTMLIAAKERGLLSLHRKWKLGAASLISHVLIAAGALLALLYGLPGILTAVAFMPVVVRGVWGFVTLSGHLPPLRRVGVFETICAAWFITFMSMALTRLAY